MSKVALIADRDQPTLELLVSTLEFFGYEIISVSSKAEALNIIETKHLDIVICDIMLIGIDNIDKIELKKHSDRLGIMFTGVKELNTFERKSLFCKNITFLQKPFSPVKLADRLFEYEGKG